MLSLLLSTVAYFVASHYIKRYLDEIGAPKGLTRSVFDEDITVTVRASGGGESSVKFRILPHLVDLR